MATGAQTWSTSAASNNSADGSVNWAEGQAPSSVNNSARAEMASVAMWIKDNSGTLLTSGSTAAYTVTSMQVSTAYVDGYTIAVNFHADNNASATLNVDGIGAKAIQIVPGTNLSTGDIVAGTSHRLHYSSSSTAWIIEGGNLVGASSISSDKLADDAVGLTKIANIGNGTVLANVSGSSASPTAVTIGTGLSYNTTTLSAPAFPPPSVFKNLSIKVASTTTINCDADWVTMATSGSSSFVTLEASGTINTASTDVANGLSADSTALAHNTKYYLYAIAASATSTHADWLMSVSATTPLMPSGYGMRGRYGAVLTATSTATPALLGSYQFGRRLQFDPTLGSTAANSFPKFFNGSAATGAWTSVDASTIAPGTASEIFLTITSTNGGVLGLSSVTGIGTPGSTSVFQAPYTHGTGGSAVHTLSGSLILQSTAVFYYTDTAGTALTCWGWIDNI